jgi:rhamnose transport system ATP-binding protein
VLSLRQISVTFGAVRALAAVDLELRPGEVHALVGENGAGKSTLLRVLGGVIAPDMGTIEWRGERLTALTPRRAQTLGISVVHQHPALLHELTVAENLLFGSDGAWISWPARRAAAKELLAQVGADIDVDAIAGALPLPAQQLVQLARALRQRPTVLVLDEPTAVLPEAEAQRLLSLVRALRDAGTAVLYVSHRLEELAQFADRVTVLRDGVRVFTSPMAEVTTPELIRHMVGRDMVGDAARAPRPTGAEVLALEHVGSRDAGVRDISFALRQGEILGLAGLVGAGRTELAECLFGLRRIDAGTVRLGGRAFAPRSPADAIAAGVVLVPEDRRRHGVIPAMTLTENVTLPHLHEFARHGLLDARAEAAVAVQAVADYAVRTAGVGAALATLSGGNQQKVALARWLRHRPAVLILDEPTQGIDVGARAEIHDRIRREAAAGTAVLLISSDLPELFLLSDRIAVLHQGTLAGVLSRRDTTPEAVMALCVHGPARRA